MSRHSGRRDTFLAGIDRARQLCDIHGYLVKSAPAALDPSDLLRSAVVMGMSALDLLVHSIYLQEAVHRYRSRGNINGLKLSFGCITADESGRERAISDDIYRGHLHKAFMAPDKIGEVLAHLLSNPWSAVAIQAGQDEKEMKGRLREIYRWRNRIAHEADINPALGGIELWPILEEDVRDALAFLVGLGGGIVAAVEAS